MRTHAAQTSRASDWITAAGALPPQVAAAVTNRSALLEELRAASTWLAERWNRSHVIVTPADPAAAARDPCGNASTAAAAAAAVIAASQRALLRGTNCTTIVCIREALGVVVPAAVGIPPISTAGGGVPSFRSNVSIQYQVTQTAVLARYMDLIQAYGAQPIRFNGGLLTWTPLKSYGNFTPDWRQWGSGLWLQNTRLMYWPALAAGDYDATDAFFAHVVGQLPLCELKVRVRDALTRPKQGTVLAATPADVRTSLQRMNLVGHAGSDEAQPHWRYNGRGEHRLGIMGEVSTDWV